MFECLENSYEDDILEYLNLLHFMTAYMLACRLVRISCPIGGAANECTQHRGDTRCQEGAHWHLIL